MKRLSLLLGVFLLFLFHNSLAQQSLFNTPSLVITKHKHYFFQEQINASPDGVAINLNTAYGLGKGIEIGVNVVGLNIGAK